jgi:hypothetical protein
MEIREGIKYTYGDKGKIAEVFKSTRNRRKSFYSKFESGGLSGDFTQSEWVADFKSGKLKLIEYPYKVGDWVFDINNTYSSLRNRVVQILKIDDSGIWCNDKINTTYLPVKDFNIYYRPCFKEEIEVKEVKPDYSYLKEILNKLNL